MLAIVFRSKPTSILQHCKELASSNTFSSQLSTHQSPWAESFRFTVSAKHMPEEGVPHLNIPAFYDWTGSLDYSTSQMKLLTYWEVPNKSPTQELCPSHNLLLLWFTMFHSNDQTHHLCSILQPWTGMQGPKWAKCSLMEVTTWHPHWHRCHWCMLCVQWILPATSLWWQ